MQRKGQEKQCVAPNLEFMSTHQVLGLIGPVSMKRGRAPLDSGREHEEGVHRLRASLSFFLKGMQQQLVRAFPFNHVAAIY